MNSMVDDNLKLVFEYLNVQDSFSVMATCTRFRKLAKEAPLHDIFPIKREDWDRWFHGFKNAKCFMVSYEFVDDDDIHDLVEAKFFSNIDTFVLNYVDIDRDSQDRMSGKYFSFPDNEKLYGLLTGNFLSFLPKNIKHLHIRSPCSSEVLEFEDSDFAFVSHLTSLSVYRMANSGLTNNVFDCFENLRHLDMGETELTDDAVRHLTLESLCADECKITGEGINFKFLRTLSIKQCRLIKIDLFKGQVTKLIDLNVWNCEHLTDKFFQDLMRSQTVKVQRLNVSYCAHTYKTIELFPHAIVDGRF